MAWIEKKGGDSNIELPTGYPAFSRISSFVKHLINASQYYYHESESFEVKEVILNQAGNRGSVRGSFINNPNQPILGGVVKPLMPNIIQVPLVGEEVVVIEYNGQHYYTGIIMKILHQVLVVVIKKILNSVKHLKEKMLNHLRLVKVVFYLKVGLDNQSTLDLINKNL